MYNEVIVVEGKNDQERIAKLYKDALVITTNGSQISKETLTAIKTLSQTHKIILLLDPDYPGERIRSIITDIVPDAQQAFIRKKDAISTSKKKVGVEHATDKIIREAIDNLLTKSDKAPLITLEMLYDLELCGTNDSKDNRNKLSDILGIGQPNSKTFLKRINMLNIDYNTLKGMKENL